MELQLNSSAVAENNCQVRLVRHPEDLFVFPDGTRCYRRDLGGKIYRGELTVLYYQSFGWWEAILPTIELRD